MREDRTPTQASFHRLNLPQLADDWAELVAGIKWAIETLEDEAIFDEARLPTVAVLPVLVALHRYIPQAWMNLGGLRRYSAHTYGGLSLPIGTPMLLLPARFKI